MWSIKSFLILHNTLYKFLVHTSIPRSWRRGRRRLLICAALEFIKSPLQLKTNNVVILPYNCICSKPNDDNPFCIGHHRRVSYSYMRSSAAQLGCFTSTITIGTAMMLSFHQTFFWTRNPRVCVHTMRTQRIRIYF